MSHVLNVKKYDNEGAPIRNAQFTFHTHEWPDGVLKMLRGVEFTPVLHATTTYSTLNGSTYNPISWCILLKRSRERLDGKAKSVHDPFVIAYAHSVINLMDAAVRRTAPDDISQTIPCALSPLDLPPEEFEEALKTSSFTGSFDIPELKKLIWTYDPTWPIERLYLSFYKPLYELIVSDEGTPAHLYALGKARIKLIRANVCPYPVTMTLMNRSEMNEMLRAICFEGDIVPYDLPRRNGRVYDMIVESNKELAKQVRPDVTPFAAQIDVKNLLDVEKTAQRSYEGPCLLPMKHLSHSGCTGTAPRVCHERITHEFIEPILKDELYPNQQNLHTR